MRNQAKANLSALIESTEDLIWSVDLDYRKVVFNRALKENIEGNFGTRVEVGTNASDDLPPERATLWAPLYDRALAEGPYRTEYSLADGRTLELSFNPILVDGKATGISVFGKDITDRKKAEKALQEAESRYRNIFDGALEGMFQTSPEAKALIVNPALAKMLGYDSPDDLLATVTNAIDDVWADPEEHARFTRQIMADGTVRGFEAKFKRKDGAIVWGSLSCRKVCALDGQLLYIEGFIEEITERKAAESALQEAEKRYRNIFDGALEGMFQTSAEGKPLAVNPALAKMLGYASPEEFLSSVENVSKSIWANPGDRAELLRRVEATGATLGFECQLKRKDGSEFWVSVSCRKVCGPDGRVLNLEGFMEDITERRKATLALARFRTFFEESGSVMLMVEPSTGEILAANRKAAEFYGYPKEQLIGMFTYQVSLSSPEEISLDRQRALHQECTCFHYSHRLASGEVRDIELYSSPFEVDGRQILYAILHDVTDRNRATQALAESEARFRRFFEESGSVMLIIDPLRGQIAGANRAAADYYGYTQEQLIGMPLDSINTMPAELLTLSLRQVSSQEHTHLYRRHRVASGEVRDVEIYTAPMKVNGRQLLLSVVHDVSERMHVEKALRESLELLEEAQKIGGLGSYTLDIPSGVWTSSNVLDELFGIGKDYDHTVVGWADLIDPQDRQMMANYYQDEVVGKGQAFDKEYRIVRHSDRAERWLHGLGKLEFDSQGRPIRMHGVIKDITEQKQTEIELRNSEERFRATFEQAAVGILHTSLDGHILRCNERFAEIIGYPLDEIPGMAFQQITLPSDRDESTGMATVMLDGRTNSTSWEKRYVRKDGSLTWVRLTASIQHDDDGRPLHFITVVEDINDRKAAEERLEAAQKALQASEKRYRTAFQANLDASAITRFDDGTILEVNKAFTEVHGFEHEEAVGRTTCELGLWVDPAQRHEFVGTLRKDGACRDFEVKFRAFSKIV
jgi:PAS domain S-box-containing protein